MATKESLQIRELTARKTIREALEQMSALIGVELPAPVIDPSPDPTYRNIVEWERVARDILALQAGLMISQPAIPGDDIPNAGEDVEPDTSGTAEESPTEDAVSETTIEPVMVDPVPTVEPAPETELKAKGKKK
jgi:hypothetical protein